MSTTLQEIGRRNGTDKAYKANPGQPLLEVYERRMGDRRDDEITLLEIGVLGGGSLRMWRDYFPRGRIVGIDVQSEASEHADDRIEVYIGSQSDVQFLDKVLDAVGKLDFVIDDGSHLPQDQTIALTFLWPHVRPGGLYVIEDTHASYLPDFHGGWRRPGSTIQFLKGVVDDVHYSWHQQAVTLPAVESISFHRETCVIEMSVDHRPDPA